MDNKNPVLVAARDPAELPEGAADVVAEAEAESDDRPLGAEDCVVDRDADVVAVYDPKELPDLTADAV